MRIGILQTGDSPEELRAQHGSYSDMCVKLLGPVDESFDFIVYRVLDGQFPEDARVCDGWLITGSRFSAYAPEPWIPPLKDLVRQIAAMQKPLVGICFGHQVIAEALGGKVEKSEKGWGLGTDAYQIKPDANNDLPDQIVLNVFHQDQVVELPPAAEVFASSDFCQYAGFYIGDRIMTIQAHPEYRIGFNQALLEVRRELIEPRELVDQALDTLEAQDTDADSAKFARQIGKVFRSLKPEQ